MRGNSYLMLGGPKDGETLVTENPLPYFDVPLLQEFNGLTIEASDTGSSDRARYYLERLRAFNGESYEIYVHCDEGICDPIRTLLDGYSPVAKEYEFLRSKGLIAQFLLSGGAISIFRGDGSKVHTQYRRHGQTENELLKSAISYLKQHFYPEAP